MTGADMLIRFYSDEDINGQGFAANFYRSQNVPNGTITGGSTSVTTGFCHNIHDSDSQELHHKVLVALTTQLVAFVPTAPKSATYYLTWQARVYPLKENTMSIQVAWYLGECQSHLSVDVSAMPLPMLDGDLLRFMLSAPLSASVEM